MRTLAFCLGDHCTTLLSVPAGVAPWCATCVTRKRPCGCTYTGTWRCAQHEQVPAVRMRFAKWGG